MAAKQEQGEDIFAILKEPSPIPQGVLPEEIGDVLDAAQNLFAFKAPPSSENKTESCEFGAGP